MRVVIKMGISQILEVVYSGAASGEGGLQAAARHALDVDKVNVLEGEPSTIERQWPTDPFQPILRQLREYRSRDTKEWYRAWTHQHASELLRDRLGQLTPHDGLPIALEVVLSRIVLLGRLLVWELRAQDQRFLVSSG